MIDIQSTLSLMVAGNSTARPSNEGRPLVSSSFTSTMNSGHRNIYCAVNMLTMVLISLEARRSNSDESRRKTNEYSSEAPCAMHMSGMALMTETAATFISLIARMSLGFVKLYLGLGETVESSAIDTDHDVSMCI
jgi:hypothetical protein